MKEPYQLSFRFKRPKRWERIGGIAFDLGAFATILLFALWLIGMLIPRAHAHSFYSQWMQPHNPTTSCCNNTDCEPVDGKYDEATDTHYVLIDKVWRKVPKEVILDAAKPENASPGGYHSCWNHYSAAKEFYCVRLPETRM